MTKKNPEKTPGRESQSVTCLATDASLTTDPGVPSSIPARSHTFVEIDHEVISTVILLPSAESFKKGCCQLQAKVCAQVLVNRLFKPAQEKVWLGLSIYPFCSTLIMSNTCICAVSARVKRKIVGDKKLLTGT